MIHLFYILLNPSCLACVAGADYLAWVSVFVSTYRHKILPLENPAGATLRIGGLEDTIYRDAHAKVNGWGKFYLPSLVHMQVMGVLEGTSYPCEQLVLMTCEDKKVYAYDGEELHLVAPSVKELKDFEYPASKSYYKGEACKHVVRSLAENKQGFVMVDPGD